MSFDFYQFNLPTKIVFQEGLSKDFSNELSQLAASRYLVITDKYLHENHKIDAVLEGVRAGGFEIVGVFDEVPPDSEVQTVIQAANMASSKAAEGLIAIGGGSVLDTAKAANILFSLGGDLIQDYSGTQTITRDLKPFIVIPTTSGTGSEVTAVAVIMDKASGTKLAFVDDHLYPDLAILDPEVTSSMPPRLTAMTGMDALTHAVEAVTSVQKNPMSDALAKRAIDLVNRYLLGAIRNGENIEARSAMLIAANLAGIAFDHAMVGVVHSMSHATGGIAHVPHGLANSIYLPFGMEYNLEVAARGYAEIAAVLQCSKSGVSDEENALAAIAHIRKMQKEIFELCGLPFRLKETGVQEDQLEEIAEAAVSDGASFYNPREVTSQWVLEKIKQAY